MLRIASGLVAFASIMLSAGLAGCTSASDPCDPRVSRQLLEEAGCLISGKTEQFVDQQEKELERLKSERRLSEIETREIEMDAERLARDTQAFSSEIAEQQRELANLRAKLVEASKLSAPMAARKAVLIREIDALNGELDTERAASGRSKVRITQLKTDIAKRRAVIDAMARPVLKE